MTAESATGSNPCCSPPSWSESRAIDQQKYAKTRIPMISPAAEVAPAW